jgi:hypothetical protein
MFSSGIGSRVAITPFPDHKIDRHDVAAPGQQIRLGTFPIQYSCLIYGVQAFVRTKLGLPQSDRDHRAATSDCPFENARLCGSGALLYYAAVRHQPACSAR